jgi:hypothetical protein
MSDFTAEQQKEKGEGGIDSNIEIHLDKKSSPNQSRDVFPPQAQVPEISTYRKHSMDFFTMDGVILRTGTGFSNLVDWFVLCIRELLDNAIDFLVKNYQGAVLFV